LPEQGNKFGKETFAIVSLLNGVRLFKAVKPYGQQRQNIEIEGGDKG
jgi:hypothetical protein